MEKSNADTVIEANVFTEEETESETTSLVCSEDAEEAEFRIEAWLDTRGILRSDPREKEEGFFERRKDSCRNFTKISAKSCKVVSGRFNLMTLSTKGDSFSLTSSLNRSSLMDRRRRKNELKICGDMKMKGRNDEEGKSTRSSIGGNCIRPFKSGVDFKGGVKRFSLEPKVTV